MRIMTDIRLGLHLRTAALTAAAVVTLMCAVSCGNHQHEVIVENAIGLNAFRAGTRALVNDANDLGSQSVAYGTGFGVYGYKTKSAVNTQIFTNQEVTASGSTDNYTWSYSPLKYWDMSAYYRYVAYWPYSVTGVSHSESGDTHTLSLSGNPNWQWASVGYTESGTFSSNDNPDCKDLQYAYSKDEAQNYVTLTNGFVNFTFNHVLSWLEIQVSSVLSTGATSYYITGLSIGNDGSHGFTTHTGCDIPDGMGSFTYSLNYSTQDESSMSYGTPGGSNGYASLYPAQTGQELKLTDSYQLLCSSLCVPFSVTGEGIFLNVTYNTGSGSPDVKKSVAIPLSDTENLKILEGGKKYVVKLRFEMGEPLKVVKVYIQDWADGGSYDSPVYNW